jgi:hypothetical protein
MHRLHLLLLILFALTFTGCSYAVEFVVVNESNQPIEVQCKIDGPGDPAGVVGPLSVVNTSQLRAGDRAWRKLSDGEYKVESDGRTVAARVMPGEALLVKRLHDTSIKNGEPAYFPIEEIVIAGAKGEIKLHGKQVPKAFIAETDRLFILAYK